MNRLIGNIYGVQIYESHVYIRPKPKWFPSRWLWFTLAELFTERVIEKVEVKHDR